MLTERFGPFEPKVTDVMAANAYFNWSGRGFGQLSFGLNTKGEYAGKITCSNECMNRESVRKILYAFADYIADNTILLDE